MLGPWFRLQNHIRHSLSSAHDRVPGEEIHMAMDKTQPKSAAPSQPKSKPAPALSGSARPFLLRKRNSTQVLRCPDLLTLRQWIAEKRLTRDDEVSRSGQKWRKMGTIVEFESLFYSVDQ